MAAAAGITLTWEDFADLSEITPLLARVYPNGQADVNYFHAAGGMGYVIRELLGAGLLDGSAATIAGDNLADYASEPVLANSKLTWRPSPEASLDPDILRPASDPHAANGGLRMLDGNFGKADGKLDRDVVVVVRGQGPQATGMPELHSLTPMLSNLQDKGYAVALVTDGRMSGASGSVPAAIHVTPEAVAGGPIGQLADGDMIRLDAANGRLDVDADLSQRPVYSPT